jgi:hypothetical protein
VLVDAQPLAGERTGHDHQQGHEEDVDPEALPDGSAPPTAGATYSPAASQAVAIQKMPSCTCQVRTA